MIDLEMQGLTAQGIAQKNNESARHAEMLAAMSKTPGLNISNTVEIPPDAMNELISAVKTALENLNIPVPDFPNKITVENFGGLANLLSSIIYELKKLPKDTQPPQVKVDSPTVNIDLKSLEKKLDAVLKAVKAIKVDIPETIIPDFPTFKLDNDGFPIVTVANMAMGGGGGAQSAMPLEKYSYADIDETGATKYYGFLAPDRDWYIMSDTGTAARYVSGSGGYTAAWAARATRNDYVILSEAF